MVAFTCHLFVNFSETRVARRYPGLFTIRQLSEREAYDTPAFGRLRSSAEHALCQVGFKQAHELWVRFSAIILSNELEVETCHRKAIRGREPRRQMVSLVPYLADGKVRWDAAFEGIYDDFVEFLSSNP